MSPGLHDIDAHEQPSPKLKALFKRISRLDQTSLEAQADAEIDDVHCNPSRFLRSGCISGESISRAFANLSSGPGCSRRAGKNGSQENQGDIPVFSHSSMPGLLIIPGLLPPEVQTTVLDKMLHRDLSNPAHNTNLHLHYHVPYQPPLPNQEEDSCARSLFSYPPTSPVAFKPKDLSIHKPLSINQVLGKRLHWVTLGGQYDWSAREYPREDEGDGTTTPHPSSLPPQFPRDLAGLLRGLFPETDAQAAIVNIYGTGDSMMVHRDVSEETDRGLISMSFGCEGLFMICPQDMGDEDCDLVGGEHESDTVGKRKYLLLRLKSGDAVYMAGEARCAWHGVPKILKGTCPDNLRDWPAVGTGNKEGRFEAWRGWLGEKRVNFNVRQMKE